ncbi:MAG: hypothetical protein NTX24_00145 [Candidatus Pacearchaeota archaeon]|nr:hypothetical protein [Candidatus Pacearchaeota archaeon]
MGKDRTLLYTFLGVGVVVALGIDAIISGSFGYLLAKRQYQQGSSGQQTAQISQPSAPRKENPFMLATMLSANQVMLSATQDSLRTTRRDLNNLESSVAAASVARSEPMSSRRPSPQISSNPDADYMDGKITYAQWLEAKGNKIKTSWRLGTDVDSNNNHYQTPKEPYTEKKEKWGLE